MKKKLLIILLSIASVLACALSLTACSLLSGLAHQCNYCEQVAEQKYLKSEATCTEKAVYYYSCKCGEMGTDTFEYGDEPEGHSFTKQDTNQKYLKSGSTCVEKAKYYYSCERCGEAGGEAFEYQYSALKQHSFQNGKCIVCGIPSETVGLKFTLNPDKSSYSVAKGDATDAEIVIPERHSALPVTSIDASAFENYTKLSRVNIPDTVKVIGANAFKNCGRLANVNIPDGVTEIGDSAFRGCALITSITIPDGVTKIGASVFSGCSRLETIKIPDRVTAIGEKAFENCLALSEVTIGSGVTAIGKSAFYGCRELTSITIPDSVTSMGEGAFSGCSGLQSITLPFAGDSAKKTTDGYQYPFGYVFGGYSYEGGVATEQYYKVNSSVNDYDIYYIPSSLKSVTITGSNILHNAFSNCSTITSITLGEGVTAIADRAFNNCTELVTVYWNATECTMAGYFTSPAFNNCSNLKNVIIGENVKSIPANAFLDCSGITSVTIPKNVTSIGNYAFYNCTGLLTVYWNATECTEAGSYTSPVFSKCTNLTTVVVGDRVKSLPGYTFVNCAGLTTLIISDSLKSVGDYAFENCNNIETVYYKGNLTAWQLISLNSGNRYLDTARHYYYRETKPQTGDSTDYWHYVDGVVIVWEKES